MLWAPQRSDNAFKFPEAFNSPCSCAGLTSSDVQAVLFSKYKLQLLVDDRKATWNQALMPAGGCVNLGKTMFGYVTYSSDFLITWNTNASLGVFCWTIEVETGRLLLCC